MDATLLQITVLVQCSMSERLFLCLCRSYCTGHLFMLTGKAVLYTVDKASKCLIRHWYYFILFQFVSFFVTVPQVKQSSPARFVQPVGEPEVKLYCNVKEAVSYTWYKNGKEITAAFDRYTVKEYRYLRIVDVEKSDSGQLVCVASNPHGSANCTINFLVEGIGFFVQIFPLKVWLEML